MTDLEGCVVGSHCLVHHRSISSTKKSAFCTTSFHFLCVGYCLLIGNNMAVLHLC